MTTNAPAEPTVSEPRQGLALPGPTLPAQIPGSGLRVRKEHQVIKHLAFKDIKVELYNEKVTSFSEGGGFETEEHATSMALPDGSRITKTEEVTHWCCKFRKKSQLAYCGPLTKDRVNFCVRCNRVLCARHTWQFLFSPLKRCSWCAFLRVVEICLLSVAFMFRLAAFLVRGVWQLWFRTYG